MVTRLVAGAIVVVFSLLTSTLAQAQATAVPLPSPPKQLSEQDIKNLLVWNSPWLSRTTTPGQIYSYRTVFVLRRNELFAEVMRFSNNERGDSVVGIKEGRVVWQDSSGGDVTVSIDEIGELVGTATSKTANFSVNFKPRP